MLANSFSTNEFRLMEPLFVHCHKPYVLRKNLYISKVEEKFKFPLVCTMWCQFGWSG